MKVAVTSPSFSRNKVLIEIMNASFKGFKLNTAGTRFTKEELINYLSGYDAAIVGLDQIDDEVLDALPDLKMISKYGVGLDNIDLEACKTRGVKIGWSGGVNRRSVSEMTLGNILSLLRNLYVSSNLLSNGIWEKNGGVQLTGKTVGVIGVGYIGKDLINLLKPFGCKILVNDIIDQKEYYRENGLIETSKENIFKQCDVITIHTPHTDLTHYLIDEESLKLMKENVVIINSARGGIIKQSALLTALKNKTIGGAATDVYETEPPSDLELLGQQNLICTPHIGGNSEEAILAMGKSAISHLLR